MDPCQCSPLTVLVGCGSGSERFDTGDEPLGFISGFLFAGASAIVATLWPIHDRLSGAAFTESFYGYGCQGTDQLPLRAGQVVDLARRLQKAVMDIRANPRTAAPYFWAGFILHGNWRYQMPQ